ncbi:hypothetical protein COOONC_25242, partial [Cooperia oncophora]
MKLVIFAATLYSVVLSMPHDIKLDGGIDECGAKDARKFKLIQTGDDKMDIACELCLDLVLIAETYAECGEVSV